MAVITRVSVRDLRHKMDEGKPLLILDARRGIDACAPRIPGAIRVDARHLNPGLFKLEPETEVIVYDNSAQEEISSQIVEALVNSGFKAEALLGGWHEWKDAGFPVEEPQAVAQPGPAQEAAQPMESPVDRIEEVVSDLAHRALALVRSLLHR